MPNGENMPAPAVFSGSDRCPRGRGGTCKGLVTVAANESFYLVPGVFLAGVSPAVERYDFVSGDAGLAHGANLTLRPAWSQYWRIG